MKKSLLFLNLTVLSLTTFSQLSPAITAWIKNTTTAVNPTYTSLECNVQSVYYSSTHAYISASCVPAYAIGPWVANPNLPADKNLVAKITLTPTEKTGAKTYTALGAIGLWTNGVVIYNAKDGQYWNGTAMVGGIANPGWNRNAYYWEGISFDACKGHPGPNGAYHHHVSPSCLYNQNATTKHSPIIGFAWDGFPIYGAYAYTNTNGTGAIKRMQSSYVLTTSTTRAGGPPINATYPLGSMCEDYVYTAGAGDLDQYNGRFCKTPEYPAGTYAYFTTIEANGIPAYPFVIGQQYYGTIAAGATNTAQTLPATGITQYTGATLPVEIYHFSAQLTEDKKAHLVWNVGQEQNVKQYEVERSSNAVDFEAITTVTALGKAQYFYDDSLAQGKYYYRLKTVDFDGKEEYSITVTLSLEADKYLIIHNNPAQDILTIQENDALCDRKVEIVDLTGKIVATHFMSIGTTMLSIDVQTLYAGLYSLRISGGKTKSSKLLITHR
jgi:hypothetical protein